MTAKSQEPKAKSPLQKALSFQLSALSLVQPAAQGSEEPSSSRGEVA